MTEPNPFSEHDSQEKRLEWIESVIAEQDKQIGFLRECVGLLMRAENFRLDRKNAAR